MKFFKLINEIFLKFKNVKEVLLDVMIVSSLHGFYIKFTWFLHDDNKDSMFKKYLVIK